MLDMAVDSVSRAERGAITPTIWTIIAMAEALDTDVASLLEGNDQPLQKKARRPEIERLTRLLTRLDPEVVEGLGDFVHRLVKQRRGSRRAGRG